ncbi:hypothetical protein BJV74DRAFT_868543 [Russula compacta]|nr:hypothetical protein BJV74DRAFT_868543 [Russula compacta]
MAALVAPSSLHTSGHIFPAHRDGFVAFHQHPRRSGPTGPHFEAFAPHHHSGASSRSAVASWRNSEPATQAPISARTPSPKHRRTGSSHSHTPSTVLETLNTNWRSHIRTPVVTTVDVAREPSDPHLKVSAPSVYSVTELLRLSASPLVGISKESQVIVDDLIAHYVWRRGPQLGTKRAGGRRNNRGASKPRSLHTSTDDSEHSD